MQCGPHSHTSTKRHRTLVASLFGSRGKMLMILSSFQVDLLPLAVGALVVGMMCGLLIVLFGGDDD